MPTHPGPDRLWSIIEKHRATTLYTAPTAIRALMVHGNAPVLKHDLTSLRMLGSCGEPIGPEAWWWYYSTVGKQKLPVFDSWWQVSDEAGNSCSALMAVNRIPRWRRLHTSPHYYLLRVIVLLRPKRAEL